MGNEAWRGAAAKAEGDRSQKKAQSGTRVRIQPPPCETRFKIHPFHGSREGIQKSCCAWQKRSKRSPFGQGRGVIKAFRGRIGHFNAVNGPQLSRLKNFSGGYPPLLFFGRNGMFTRAISETGIRACPGDRPSGVPLATLKGKVACAFPKLHHFQKSVPRSP